jgi:HEAT repeat protein
MGFREFITSRLYRQQLSESWKRERPANLTPRQIAQLVPSLLNKDDRWEAWVTLEKNGRNTVPALVAALKDRRYHQIKVLEYILRLLVPFDADVVEKTALPLIDSSDLETKQVASSALAELGRDSHVELLKKLLTDPDGEVRSKVVWGIDTAIIEERASDEFRRRMYQPVLDQCNQCEQKWYWAANHAPEVLFRIDPVRAAFDLTDDRRLAVDNLVSDKVISACHKNGIIIAFERLKLLFENSWPKSALPDHYHDESVICEAVRAMVRSDGLAARPYLDRAFDSEQKSIQKAAAEALAMLSGLDDPIRYVLEREEAVGLKNLTEPQRRLLYAKRFDWEICNGGIMQFFGNSTGNMTRETLEALKCLAHPEALAALEKAIELIGPLAFEKNRDQRLTAFEGRFDELQAAFDPLEEAFYKANGRFTQCVMQYAIQHRADFVDGENSTAACTTA